MKLSRLNGSFPICENIEKKRKYILKALQDAELGSDDRGELSFEDPDDFNIFLQVLVSADPVAYKTKGKKTPFVNDILQWYIDGKIALPEDAETTREALTIYNNAKQHGSVRPISDFGSPGAVRKEYGEARAGSDTYAANAKLIDEDGEFKMYQIDDWNQGKICFADSGWCVQHEGNFRYYSPPFFMVTKGKKRYALMHISSQQIKDVEDDPLTLELAMPIKKFILRLWPEYEPDLEDESDIFYLAKLWPNGEQVLARDPTLSYFYAKDVIGGRFPEAEPEMAENPSTALKYAEHILKGRFPEAEEAISEHPMTAYRYAVDVLKGRFPQGEPEIAKMTSYENLIHYAKNMIKGRWPEAEQYIVKSGLAASKYAVEVIQGPWPQAEPVILNGNSAEIIDYAAGALKRRWPEAEESLSKWSDKAIDYAMRVVKGPWPEGEDAIAMDAFNSFLYADKVLKDRFPKGEPKIATEVRYAYRYAREVIKGRFPLGEADMIKNIGDTSRDEIEYVMAYTVEVIQGPWPAMEEEFKNWEALGYYERYQEFLENPETAIAAAKEWD